MRIILALLATSALAACGGSDGGAITSVSTTTSTTSTGTTVNNYTEFTNPTTAHTYTSLGGDQFFSYSTDSRNCCQQQAQTYAADLSTPHGSVLSITYNPTAATYTLALNDTATTASASTAFQDPASKISFSGGNPQWGTPNNLNTQSNIVYYQAGDGSTISPYLISGSGEINPGNATTPPSTGINQTSTYTSNSFFFQQPGGTAPQYVTLAGYVRNVLSFAPVTDPTTGATYQNIQWTLTRGAFAYGVQTTNSSVPTTGTATFNGNMLASMVYNTNPQFGGGDPTLFQWITGTASTAVDFGKNTVTTNLTGTVQAPQVDTYTTYNPANTTIAAGSTFNATGTATINMSTTGGFTGTLSSATFTTGTTVTKINLDPTASVLNGTFYGPAAQEVGGGFRAVGTNPNQRVDIIGAFVGK